MLILEVLNLMHSVVGLGEIIKIKMEQYGSIKRLVMMTGYVLRFASSLWKCVREYYSLVFYEVLTTFEYDEDVDSRGAKTAGNKNSFLKVQKHH